MTSGKRLLIWALAGLWVVLVGIACGLLVEQLPKVQELPFRFGGAGALRYAWLAGYAAFGLAAGYCVTLMLRDPLPDLATIALKAMRQRLLASFLTSLSVALGVGLMVTILVINGVVTRMFDQSATGYHLIIGAKGSPMQLVLNTIYFMDRPIENLPWSVYTHFKGLKSVERAIPFALGDTTDDGLFRIVGTLPEYFTVPYVPRKNFVLESGAFLEKPQDAVIGSRVAATKGWKVGTKFPIAHGGNVDDLHTNNPFRVVGILAPTGTPNDRAVFVHLDGFYLIAGHEKPLDEALEREEKFRTAGVLPPVKPDAPPPAVPAGEIDPRQKEVTAILLRMKEQTQAILMQARLNEGLALQAANPIAQIQQLLRNVVSNIRTLLVVLTSLIIVVSGVSIFVSIYNSMSDRRREIAIMRALGAGRVTVFSIIIAESLLLCTLGGIGGVLLGHTLVWAAAGYAERSSDILINPLSFELAELYLVPALTLLAVIVGFVPGYTAYRADVAKGLAD